MAVIWAYLCLMASHHYPPNAFTEMSATTVEYLSISLTSILRQEKRLHEQHMALMEQILRARDEGMLTQRQVDDIVGRAFAEVNWTEGR